MASKFIEKCLPPDPNDAKTRFQQRMVLYIAFAASLVGFYSVINWNSMGMHAIGHTAWLVAIGQPLCAILNKLDKIPRVIIAHLSIATMTIHAINMIFHLGGIHSNHSWYRYLCLHND